MSKRRDPVPAGAKYYKEWCRRYREEGKQSEAIVALENAWNHLENAAFYEAEKLDSLLAAWESFPGRSCTEQEWNLWMMRMEAAAKKAKGQIT